ncbi:hypothetical protein FF80_02443 [Devosia sp. LC5]|uniref:hypothetical protein n=1 Tax=Devosia sp. LC5 TaxID=1502724 RepID=UPI0004E3AED9|nr:hypothetical protein [Devosia sp. LC5]KFC66676.1 hypothetical protein FF80_02443 [Devosia sp. LC5]
MTTDFKLLAKVLVDQHYAAGPDRLKEVLAQALADASAPAQPDGQPRERLLEEVAELEKTSQRGSE